MPPSTPIDPTSHILIVRLSAIGDAIHGMPVANALRRHFPAAKLAWVVESRAAGLLRGHSALDELIEVPRGWLKRPKDVLALRRRFRLFAPEIAIDLQGLTKSAVAGWLSGARRRIGYGGKLGRELSPWFYTEQVQTTKAHVIDKSLELLGPLGIESPEVRFDVPESEADRTSAETMIRQARLESRGFALLNPGAGWPSKLWPAERYAAVASYLGRSHGLPTMVVWAGNEERNWAEQIVAGSDGHAQLAPSTSLSELAALTRRGRLFVGSDTGPLHLAVAVGTSCVGMYGPMPAVQNGPYGPKHIALQERHFEGTSRERRNASSQLMEAIGVDLVCEACGRILRRDESNAA